MTHNFKAFSAKNKSRVSKRTLCLALLLLCTGLCQVTSAQQAATEKITLRLNKTTARQIIEAIDKQSHYAFLFAPELLESIHLNQFEVKVQPLQEVLNLLTKQYGLEFSVTGDNISVKPGARSAKPGTAKGFITGRVTTDGGLPLAGATIHLGKNNMAVNTDSAGYYSFTNVAPGTYAVQLHYVGYTLPVQQNITVEGGKVEELYLQASENREDLNSIVVRADRAITTTDRKLVEEVRKANGVVSGISSEQITISVDRSASEVARRVAGISLQDGFISIRGMMPRYNPVYLNDAYLPSTDPNKRAFNFDLLPSNTIDRILVYKTAAPELPADFAGGVVKVYTKKAMPVRRLEISVNGQYRTGNHFFDDHTTAARGKYDWLGYDDGSRQIPDNMPRTSSGQVVLTKIPNVPNTYTRSNEVITRALLQRATHSWNLEQVHHNADVLADLSYYDYLDLGKMRLNSVSVARYEHQRTYFKSYGAVRDGFYKESEFPTDGAPLTPEYRANFRRYYDSTYQENVKAALMQQLSLTINSRHSISFMGMFNRSTKNALQINTLTEFAALGWGNLHPRRIESAYNNQDLFMGNLNGEHKWGSNDQHKLEWNASYAEGISRDPNQFSNVYRPDAASVTGNVDAGEKSSLNITDNTTWTFVGVTRLNTTVGRFTDAEGKEKRKQGSLDYTINPVKRWKDFLVRAGGYYEEKSKGYSMSTLAFKDYPAMGYSKTPWTNIGDSILWALQQPGAKPMHTETQTAGVGSVQTNGYTATYKNAAGYVAVNIPLSFHWPLGKRPLMKADIYGGVRMEYSERKVLTAEGKQIFEETAFNNGPVLISTAAAPFQHFYLPSVVATWHVTTQHQVRLAYSKTLNRPELRELSPFLTYNPSDGFTYVGKPTLHDAHIANYDVRWEYYPTEGETVSAGLYYKKLDEPIEDVQMNLIGTPGYMPDNLVYAKIKGVEIEVRKKLDFIKGDFFRHMGIIVNACYNKTETNNNMRPNASGRTNYYPGGTTRPFMGAAPWIINAGLFYDNKETGSRISAQFNLVADRMLMNIGNNVTEDPWVFEASRSLLDVSVLQRLNSWLSMRVAAQNLLNAPIRWYVDGNFDKRYSNTPGQFTETYYNAPGDPITNNKRIQSDYYLRDYRPGVYYTIGFQFTLQGKNNK